MLMGSMRPSTTLLPAALLLLASTSTAPVGAEAGDAAAAQAPAAGPALAAALRQCEFVPNRGQWPTAVRYGVFGDSMGWLHDDGFTLRYERWQSADDDAAAPRQQSGCVVRTRFLGAAVPEFVADTPLPGRRSFLLGADQARWCSDLPATARVRMRGVQPGIDVLFRPLPSGRSGVFEYDLELAPGADLTRFVARCEGADEVHVDGQGRLCLSLTTPDGPCTLVQEAPIAWQDTPTGRRPLQVAFRLLDAVTYGFVAADLDPTLAAVVDPGVVWGTYLGGGASERVASMRWRPGSGIWVAGWAGSTDFPTTVGAFRTTGGADGFVARFDDTGTTLQFATYLGGSLGDEVRGLDVGPGNRPTVVGFTRSLDFPLTAGALQTGFGGASSFLDIGDAFVSTLNDTGTALLASTYLGGLFDDVAEAVVVDDTGAPIVVGWSTSPNLPTTPGVVQPLLGGLPLAQSDGFVARLAPNGQSMLAATFHGGQGGEQFLGVDLDRPSGDIVVGGWTLGADYPVTANALRTTSAGGLEGVITRFNATLTARPFSSYLGGIASDVLQGVRIAADGSIWTVGFTDSVNFPTTLDAPQRVLGGGNDAFAARLSANGSALLFSTLHGGAGGDKGRAIDVDSVNDRVLFVGEAGIGMPVSVDAPQPQLAGGVLDAFVVLLTNGGARLEWATYLGGVNQDVLASVALAPNGFAVIGGWTFSPDYPLGPPAYQGLRRGTSDGVVQQLDLVTDFGEGMIVLPGAGAAPSFVGPGEQQLLAATLQNVTARPLAVDAFRLLLAGAGDAAARVSNLRVLARPNGGTASVVGSLASLSGDDREFDLLLQNCIVPASDSLELSVVADVTADPAGATVEFAAAIVEVDAWELRSIGGSAVVRAAGTGRADGRVLVLGRVPGDLDGDGRQTVVDVRRQLAALGSIERAADVDGDGQVTPVDVAATRAAVLGRPLVLAVPAQLTRGSWITLRGLLPELGALQASLGGRSMLVGTATPREVTLRVDAAQPVGPQDLIVTLGGRTLVARLVDVQ
jgi:hypothetical protein